MTQITMKYIDLGLTSGTLWSDTNEEGFYTFDDAVKKYGDSLPTREQLEELMNHCKWEWNGSGYNVTGPNGNSIILPAAGYRHCDGGVYRVVSSGLYWPSTHYDSDGAWYLYFNSDGVVVYYCSRCHGFSVRLVKSKDNNIK